MAKITVSYFRKVYKEFLDEKITMSRMIEKFNERAEDKDVCKRCKEPFDDFALRETGLCTGCFTCNA